MTGLKRNSGRLKISDNPLDISGQFKQGKAAVYQFKLNRSSKVYVALSADSAKTNVDLQLLNAKKRVLQQSAQPGATSEFISTNLKRGEYVVRVSKRNSGNTNFRLKIATTDAPPSFISQGLTAAPGQTISFSSNQLRATDNLQAADQLRYKVTATPRNGVLKLNGTALEAGASFTQTDINQGRLSYTRSTGKTTVLGNGSRPLVSGFNIVWEGAGGSDGGTDQEIFFFNGKTTQQLTRNNVADRVEGIDGSQVVWSSQAGGVNAGGAATYELYTFNGDTGATTQLTSNNALNEDFIDIDGSNIYWLSPVGGLDRKGQVSYELFYYNGSTTRQLTSNSSNEVVGNIEGGTAVWSADVGPDTAEGIPTSEIFYFNGNTVRQLTNNSVDDITPFLKYGQVAWAAKSGTPNGGTATYELFRFNGSSTQQITSNNIDDTISGFDGNSIVWTARTGVPDSRGVRNLEIYRSDGVNTQQLTNNDVDDSIVQTDGSNLLWTSLSGPTINGQKTYELYFSNGVTTTRLTNNAVNDIPVALVGNKAIWYSPVGAADATGTATSEIFYFDGTKVQQLTSDIARDDFPSFSNTTLAWRSTSGSSSQIIRYELGDSFKFQLSDRSNQPSLEQVFNIDFV